MGNHTEMEYLGHAPRIPTIRDHFVLSFDLSPLTLRFPGIKGKLLSIVFVGIILLTSAAASSKYPEGNWFSRSGAIVVAIALGFAFRAQISEKTINSWADEAIDSIQLDIQVNNTDMRPLMDDRDYMASLNHRDNPLTENQFRAIQDALSKGPVSFTPASSYRLLLDIRDSLENRQRFAHFFNRRMQVQELFIGILGTAIWAYGDLII